MSKERNSIRKKKVNDKSVNVWIDSLDKWEPLFPKIHSVSPYSNPNFNTSLKSRIRCSGSGGNDKWARRLQQKSLSRLEVCGGLGRRKVGHKRKKYSKGKKI